MAIYTPGILLLPDDMTNTALKVISILLCLFIMQSAMAGHYFWKPLSMPTRLWHAADGAILLLFVFFSNILLFAVGVAGFVFLTFINRKQKSLSEAL